MPLSPARPLWYPQAGLWGCSALKIPGMTSPCSLREEVTACSKFLRVNVSLRVAGMNGREEVWPPSSLSFLLPGSLICFIFCPLMWLMSGQTVWVSGKREVPFRPHPEPQASSLRFLTLTAHAADGTLNPMFFSCCPLQLFRERELLKGRPQVPRPLCLTWYCAHGRHSNIESIERVRRLSHL